MNRSAKNPCRQLNSETIKSAALCYLGPIISGKCSIISAKSICDVQQPELQQSWSEICPKRDKCDKALTGKLIISQVFCSKGRSMYNHSFLLTISGIKNVAFFVSAITTHGKPKSKKRTNGNDECEDDVECEFIKSKKNKKKQSGTTECDNNFYWAKE